MASGSVLERLAPAARTQLFGLAAAEWETIVPVLAEQEAEAARTAAGAEQDAEASAAYAERLAASFREFIRAAWPIIEPATPFVGGYHVEAIAAHLEAISRGELLNLIINVPPRHSKSSLVSVLWPVWEWIEQPALRWLFVSYGQPLSTRDSVKRRRLIEAPWYRAYWGDRYALTSDQNQKMRYENSRTGVMIATSVGGVGTGEGGLRRVIDDPHAADEVESDAKRAAVLDWWDGTLSTRADQPGETVTVVVMQRLHERDLVGHIKALEAEGGESYDHLILPAEYEPTVQVCLAGLGHDPRSEPGELLSPERFNRAAIDKLKVSLGEHRAAGQLQQRPAPAGGSIFKTAWWADGRARYDLAEHQTRPLQVVARWLSLDTAFKDQEWNDQTACIVGEWTSSYRLRVRHLWSERLEMPDLLRQIEATAAEWNRDGKLEEVVIEDKGSGTSAIQTLRAASPAWLADRIVPFMPVGSKLYRARHASLWCAREMVELPFPSADIPWLFDLEQLLEKFPAVEHDDPIDALVQLVLYLEKWFERGFAALRGAAA